MLSGDELKNILYSTIDSIGKEKIRSDITSNINFSEKYIDLIMAESITKINVATGHDKDGIIADLSEALLHFMLTVSTLPSERKVSVRDDLIIDVVLPNLQNLYKSPDKSIIIEIIRNKADLDKISQLELIQANYKNIWLLSVIPFSTTKYRMYGLSPGSRISDNRFSTVITDIDNFLRQTGDKSLRFIQ